ncbi:MAG: DNA cytosine methyltransferase [Chloroflexota bacterium]
MRRISTLSLFSGAGGLDIGFHQAGYDIVACVEIEEKYCKTLKYNQQLGTYFSTQATIYNQDIREFDPTPYQDKGIECIVGGPPCQTFSAAGRRSGGVIGTNDMRGKLYESYCRILDSIQPKVFIFENVYGILGANGGEPWREIVKAFTEHGYILFSEILDAADYGVPQHRERLFLVGVRDGFYHFPMPTYGPDADTGQNFVSALDSVQDLQSEDEPYHVGLGGLYGHLLPEIPEGLNYAFFTAEMGHPEPVFAWRSKFHDLLYKANRHEPCRTLKASPGKFTGPLHWKNRYFTMPELKRLQTFPDDYELVGSYKQVMEQIGNAVPSKLAYHIAVSVREQILEPMPIEQQTFSVRPPHFQSTFRTRQREKTKQFRQRAEKAIEAKYGRLTYLNADDAQTYKSTKFYVSRPDKYTRELSTKRPKGLKTYSNIQITEIGRHIRIDLDEISGLTQSKPAIQVDVKIQGLEKYIPRFQTLRFSASIPTMSNIFDCWKEIEACLIERSNFFTLIDIYGHYANRGDAIHIETEIHTNEDTQHNHTEFLSSLIYFSQTKHCGEFLCQQELCQNLEIHERELDLVIQELRNLRYDVRTNHTHPIVKKDQILCTYPFPLLSPKALVESKALVLAESPVAYITG